MAAPTEVTRMKKRLFALLIVFAMLIGLFAACRGTPAEPIPTPSPPEASPAILPDEEEADVDIHADITPWLLPPETQSGILAFSQDLFHAVLTLEAENPLFSPLSAYYALAMTALGADGQTALEFLHILGRDPMELAQDLQSLTASLSAAQGNTALNIAGGVWTDENFVIHPEFAALLEEYFGAPAKSLDFEDPATVQEINAWVREQTHGLIEELLSSIGRDAVMLLVNTLYFSAQWAEAFHPMTAFDGFFRLADGTEVETPFLSTRAVSLPVFVTERYEAVSLPYDDDRLGFLLVRPTDGRDIRQFASDFDLSGTLASLEMRDSVRVRMPKLDLTFDFLLNDLLQHMGLITAFGDEADFSGLTAEDETLRISRVLQKVRLLVDEDGTEAAAATAIEIEATSINLDQLDLVFDTAYLYVIYDVLLGIPLFMGVLENPAV